MEYGTEEFEPGQPVYRRYRLAGNGGESSAAPSRPIAQSQLVNNRTYVSSECRDNSHMVQGDVIHNSYYIQASDIHSRQGDIRSLVAEKETYENLRNSLNFPRMSARLLNVEQALPKTCDWFFSHEQFAEWTNVSRTFQHHGFLWIKGKPGSGKSTIMKLLYEHAKTQWPDQITISYFFNGRAPSDLEKSSLGLYRSLVSQILSKLPQVAKPFLNDFATKEQHGNVEVWTELELKSFLLDVVTSRQLGQTWNIFVDALDEGSEDDVRQMVAYLEKLAASALSLSSPLRICLSSRHYPHISIRKGLQIVLEDQDEHINDIRIYLQDMLDLELHGLGEEVCRKSAGIFLWVVVVVRMLNAENDEGGDAGTARELLNSLPTDLTDLFEDILAKSTKDSEDCISLLQWVLFSLRPLTPKELYVAIHYSRACPPSPNSIPPDDQRLRRFLLHRSRGLVETTSDEQPVVQFIHETVQAFLLDAGGLARVKPELQVNLAGQSHQKLKCACFQFIKHNKPGYESLQPQRELFTADRLSKQLPSLRRLPNQVFWPGFPGTFLVFDHAPFVEYAVKFLLRHADAALEQGNLGTNFLQTVITEDVFAICCQYLEHRDDMSLLDVAAAQNLKHLLQCLINAQVDVNARNDYFSTALHAACATGCVRIAQLLLDNGADVNGDDETWVKTFAAAFEKAKSSTPDLVRLLHRYGLLWSTTLLADLLEMSICHKSFECTQILLNIGADPNARNADGRTMLAIANLAAVHLLLEHGANVDAETREYGSVLQLASFKGDERFVRILLKAGANVNAQNGKYGNALLAAVCNNRRDVVQILLEAGADIESQSGRFRSALEAASFYGYRDIAALLMWYKA
ncbi:hypothetical protein H2198_005131 [Neophaeococcomyces mojaviensis]|uniref:Uncharacterized protein n=1 Tax=Neophaeococcomyces mojaviensis TaxID=3383035 RepID=A0ACC3A6J6_9EURO|nr:hypothetical protein H2198_005131 [Knufia sp. JES_112]